MFSCGRTVPACALYVFNMLTQCLFSPGADRSHIQRQARTSRQCTSGLRTRWRRHLCRPPRGRARAGDHWQRRCCRGSGPCTLHTSHSRSRWFAKETSSRKPELKLRATKMVVWLVQRPCSGAVLQLYIYIYIFSLVHPFMTPSPGK